MLEFFLGLSCVPSGLMVGFLHKEEQCMEKT